MSAVHRIIIYIFFIGCIIVCATTIFAAYSGQINPQDFAIAPLMCMVFPFCIIATLVVLFICIIVKRWLALIPIVTLICCIGPIFNYSPVNIALLSHNNHNDKNSFSLLCYNAYNFIAHNNYYPADSTNVTLSYIIDTDADIVCLQECEYLSPLPRWHVYSPQVDSIKKQYPYRIIGAENGQSLFSKFPVKKISSDGYYSHFEVELPSHKLDIIDVHLRSIRLSKEDKKQYNDAIAELMHDTENDNIISWKGIASKIVCAAKQRAKQAIKLREYINAIDNDNIIVCGDFNDVPNCFAINTIADGEFDDVYAECGFGPMITYHGDNIYFRIDHILYKGDFDATSIVRGDINSSDHYPLFATFNWDND
ncbi:MAG: hypothetical protein E7081_09025 [Bacteroidales bacterium]|nr:hypothetical protein [Bacteroidales bacterium]